MATVSGQTVKIGDWVGFKSHVDQMGQIVDIKRTYSGTSLTIENPKGFHGDLSGETVTTELAVDCWLLCWRSSLSQ